MLVDTMKEALNGDIEAMFRLGTMYAFGNGVAVDVDEALYWLKKAAKAGHSTAGVVLQDVEMLSSNELQAERSIVTTSQICRRVKILGYNMEWYPIRPNLKVFIDGEEVGKVQAKGVVEFLIAKESCVVQVEWCPCFGAPAGIRKCRTSSTVFGFRDNELVLQSIASLLTGGLKLELVKGKIL